MYRFKYYYKDGTTEISSLNMDAPEELYEDFDGLIEWEELYSFDLNKPTVHEVLEVAMRAYKDLLKDFYRIEIINDETNEVVDYIDEREVKNNV